MLVGHLRFGQIQLSSAQHLTPFLSFPWIFPTSRKEGQTLFDTMDAVNRRKQLLPSALYATPLLGYRQTNAAVGCQLPFAAQSAAFAGSPAPAAPRIGGPPPLSLIVAYQAKEVEPLSAVRMEGRLSLLQALCPMPQHLYFKFMPG